MIRNSNILKFIFFILLATVAIIISIFVIFFKSGALEMSHQVVQSCQTIDVVYQQNSTICVNVNINYLLFPVGITFTFFEESKSSLDPLIIKSYPWTFGSTKPESFSVKWNSEGLSLVSDGNEILLVESSVFSNLN